MLEIIIQPQLHITHCEYIHMLFDECKKVLGNILLENPSIILLIYMYKGQPRALFLQVFCL